MLQVVVACLLFSRASCIRLGEGRVSTSNVPAAMDDPDLRQECEGKARQWTSEGGVRRLEGPAFFFHVNHHNGRGFSTLATRAGCPTRGFTRWSDVDDVKAGRTINDHATHNGYNNGSMFKDKSWTDIEDTFAAHTLDDLGCGPASPRVFVTSARHPVENLLTHEAFKQTKKYGMMESCESDNVALRLWAGNVCGPSKRRDDCRVLTRRDLEIAKARARKMDAIFLVEHPVTFRLGCTRLGWRYCPTYGTREQYSLNILNQLDNRSWSELFERHKLGLEFYDYLKQLSFDMLKEDGIRVPTLEEQQEALPVLRSLQDAKKKAVPDGPVPRQDANTSSTRWQCR